MTAVEEVHDLTAAIRRVESRSTRSRQLKVGASEIGECRRRTAYRVAGVKPTDESSGLQAALGTWIHKGALAVLRKEYGATTEVRLDSELVKGHADAVYWDFWSAIPPEDRLTASDRAELGELFAILEDLKTRGRYSYDWTIENGPRRKEWYQVHLYAWMLRTGQIVDRRVPHDPVPVERVRVRFIDRDTGRNHTVETDYDGTVTAEALNWIGEVLEAVEDGGPEAAPRDGLGPDVSAICDYCPFLTACWGPQQLQPGGRARQSDMVRDDPATEAAAVSYDHWRDVEKNAKEQKAFYRAQLDASPAGVYGPHKLTWSESEMKLVPDKDAAVDRLRELGEEVPLKWSGGVRTLRVTSSTPVVRKPRKKAAAPAGDPAGEG